MKNRSRKVRIVAFVVLAFFVVNVLMIVFPAIFAKADDTEKYYVSVTLDGAYINFDALPYIVNQRTIVPVRFLMEALDAEVSWDGDAKKVTVIGEQIKMELFVGSTTAYLNGKETVLDVGAELRYDRVFVPLRFVSENMGLTVEWDGKTKTVILKTTDKTPVKPSQTGAFTFNNVEQHGNKLVFMMSSSGFEYKTTVLSQPKRLVVDISSCVNKLVSAPFNATEYLNAFRYSQFTFNPDVVRFVMELKDNVSYNIEVQGSNLVVSFLNGTENPDDGKTEAIIPPDKEEKKTDDEASAGDTGNKEDEKEKNESQGTSKPISETVIVIDPGHGGSDPGACGYDSGGKVILKEKDPNLYISMKLFELLKAKGFKVYVTRDSDVYVDLIGRAEMANSLNADYFVSIHNNASESFDVRGTMVMYAYDTPKANMKLSGKEMASVIQKHLVSTIETRDCGPVKNSALAVLNKTKMPAVIVEGLFVSNAEDRKLLTNEAVLDSIARAVYEGILEIIEL